MHEARILLDLRRRLIEIAEEAGPVRITRASVWLGHLSHLTEGTLRERWADTVQGTAAQGSTLSIVQSDDPTDPRALRVVLRDVDVEETARVGMPRSAAPGPGVGIPGIEGGC